MFRVFRHFRRLALSDGNAMRYLRYALGEIVLVVLGILIALQINNWNEERLEQVEIREHALNIAAAIGADMAMLGPVEMQIRVAMRQAEELAAYLRDRPMENVENADLFFLTTMIGYRPYSWNRAALEQLKAAAGLRKIQNERLAQLISDYDALTHHLDQDYSEDDATARVIGNLTSRLVNLNYAPEGIEVVKTWDDGFTVADMELRLKRFRDSPEYRQLAALAWPVLSGDLAEYHRLANLNLSYAERIAPRVDLELPRLREIAADIQTIIGQEYR